METIQFAKQTLSFQKTVIDNSFNAMNMVQDQSEKMLSGYLENLPWVTEEGKKSLQTSIDMAKQIRDDFKKAVDDGFEQIEKMSVVK